jgi:hypothetical protein
MMSISVSRGFGEMARVRGSRRNQALLVLRIRFYKQQKLKLLLVICSFSSSRNYVLVQKGRN